MACGCSDSPSALGPCHAPSSTPTANARLIAAAPDLLAALERVRDLTDGNKTPNTTVREVLEISHLVRTAIAKARGP